MASKINISILDETGQYRKLFKIIPYNSGGFAIILPRLLASQTGRLEKTFVSYKDFGTHIDIKRDKSEQYTARDIVKFSYHTDGFVQFSSTTNSKIVSGRNMDGSPKGLGLLSWSLNNPISTGPSMTITFWGLDKLLEERVSRINTSFSFKTIEAIKHPKAIFKKEDQKAYSMALYVIPNNIVGNIINKDGRKSAYLSMMQTLPDGSYFMRLRELVRIIEIPKQNYRIAISWFLTPKKSVSNSGYIFFGPTDGKRSLVASYPAMNNNEELPMKNLSFTESETQNK